MTPDRFQGQARAFDNCSIERFQLDLHSPENTSGASGAYELNGARLADELSPPPGIQPRFYQALQESSHLIAAGGELLFPRRIARGYGFKQPHSSQRKTGGEMFLRGLAQDEFGAAPSHIQQQ